MTNLIINIINLWKDTVWENREEIDPDNELEWRALAIGFAFGKGLTINQTEEFYSELLKLDIV